MTLPELAQEFALLRKEKGITQRQLSQATGLTQPSIARFESGAAVEFGLRKLLLMLEVVGYEIQFRPAGTAPTLDDDHPIRRGATR